MLAVEGIFKEAEALFGKRIIYTVQNIDEAVFDDDISITILQNCESTIDISIPEALDLLDSIEEIRELLSPTS